MKNYNLKFKILPHIADLKIQAYGRTKEELFENAMIGMQSALRAKVKSQKPAPYRPALSKKDGAGAGSKVKTLKIKSIDLNSLLVDFLSEINYLNEVNKEVYSDIKFTKFSDKELEGKISGNKVGSFGLIIKGITYHELDIHQEKNGTWQATVLFDI